MDHAISEMERRFPDGLKNHMTGCDLIPKNLKNLTHDDTESLYVAFDADLPCKGDLPLKIERWRPKVGDHLVHQNISGLQSALKLAYKDLYPNIHTILKLLTWLRSTLTRERLCG